ncbi:hypothetical protein KAR91_45010 [Candidatus Pacearchaeota archaeon]|nr:hypothetical protein [Candidatus Pacearchaeota archaeon]
MNRFGNQFICCGYCTNWDLGGSFPNGTRTCKELCTPTSVSDTCRLFKMSAAKQGLPYNISHSEALRCLTNIANHPACLGLIAKHEVAMREHVEKYHGKPGFTTIKGVFGIKPAKVDFGPMGREAWEAKLKELADFVLKHADITMPMGTWCCDLFTFMEKNRGKEVKVEGNTISAAEGEIANDESVVCCGTCERWDKLHPCGKKGRCKRLDIMTYFTFHCSGFKEAP